MREYSTYTFTQDKPPKVPASLTRSLVECYGDPMSPDKAYVYRGLTPPGPPSPPASYKILIAADSIYGDDAVRRGLAELLRLLRRSYVLPGSRRLSQTGLAELMETTQSEISNIENGGNMRWSTFEKLLKVLGYQISAFSVSGTSGGRKFHDRVEL